MNVTIRFAEEKDYESVALLVREVHELHVKNRPDIYENLTAPLSKKEFIKYLKTPDIEIFVAENAGKITAYSILQFRHSVSLAVVKSRYYCYIDDFCVTAKHAREGIGRALFTFIISLAREKKADSIELMVWEFNLPAIRFYEKMGMKIQNRHMELKL